VITVSQLPISFPPFEELAWSTLVSVLLPEDVYRSAGSRFMQIY